MTFTIFENFLGKISFLFFYLGYLIKIFFHLFNQFFLSLNIFQRINFLLFYYVLTGIFHFLKSEFLLRILNEKVFNLTIDCVIEAILFVVQVFYSFDSLPNFIRKTTVESGFKFSEEFWIFCTELIGTLKVRRHDRQ